MYVERDIRNFFDKISSAYNIVALVGARQAGKTTFLKERMKGRDSSYVLFDDPDARKMFEEDIKKFEKQYIEGHELTVLDEVQYCRDDGSKLKYLADKGRNIWLTSSSEIILSKEILSYLVGRVSILRLYPFSLTEFLESGGYKETTSDIVKRSVWEHIVYGGYPRVVTTDDREMKKVILSDLYETMLLKDVARTFSIDDINSLEEFSRYLSFNTGRMLSYEKISRTINLSFQTIKKYLDAMEKSYIIKRISPFYSNRNKEITKQPKVYFIDTGLRNTLAKSFDPEPDGRLFENYVLSELIKLGFAPKYWRTKSKAEVDFIIEKGKEIVPMEVKLNPDSGRIERSMRSFISSYKPKRALVIYYKGKKSRIKVNGCDVHFTDVLSMRELLTN